MIEVTLTTIAAYGSFILADQLHLSGLIATVAAGMRCGSYGARTGPADQVGCGILSSCGKNAAIRRVQTLERPAQWLGSRSSNSQRRTFHSGVFPPRIPEPAKSIQALNAASRTVCSGSSKAAWHREYLTSGPPISRSARAASMRARELS